ncbi:MAG: aminotransferase class IV [Halobaculum sp.]
MEYHVDGEVVPASEATVSVADRGFAYGDALFETVRVYGGEPFAWDAHVERLERGYDRLALDGPSGPELRSRIAETLAANGFREAAVRLSVTRGVSERGLTPDPEADPTVVIRVSGLERGGVAGESGAAPSRLQTAKTRRPADRALPSDAKTHNYLPSVLARAETRVSDADEALMLDAAGNVACAAAANVWFVADDAVRTPSLDGPVLPGVTRQVVAEEAEAEGIPVEPGAYAPDAIRDAQEAFLTSSIGEVRPVETLDGVSVGGGPVTRLLARRYDERVEAACYEE